MSKLSKALQAAAGNNGGPSDPQFNYVTMLLHGDGTNGAQNSTFTDSSTNNFTVTRNGNTTQGSFSPYGSNWSNFFDGTGDYLTNTSNALITQAVSTFTAEAWVFMTSNPTSDVNYLGSMVSLDGEAANTTNYLSFGPISTRKLRLRWFDGASKYAEGATTLALNTWYHIAVVVTSNSIAMYVNGVAETLSGTTTLTARSGTSSDFSVGANYYSTFWGYISNLRVTTTAVYSGAFTPSTKPLTAIANTVLLTCQSNRFVDNSSNAYALTVGGTPSVQRFNPFGTSTEYSTSTIGGSGYFDGTGDYLTTPDNAAFDLAAGEFCLEAWVYLKQSVTSAGIMGQYNIGSGAGTYALWITSAIRPTFISFSGGVDTDTSSSVTLTVGTWNHLAVCRSGTTLSIFLNGVRTGTRTYSSTITNAATVFSVGADIAGGYVFPGYISDARVVKGSSPYDATQSTLTVPTAPLTAIPNTSLLLNYTNGAIYDNAMMNDLETSGTAQISTSVKKYGTGSIAFNGTGALVAPLTPTLNIGSGDFTFEFWVYQTSLTNYQTAYTHGYGTAGSFDVQTGSGNGKWNLYSGGGLIVSETTSTVSTNTWYHIAIARSGTSVKIFRDGVQTGSATSSANFNNTASAYIGTGSSYPLIGYMDDLRITNGYARYTANFTPPTEAFLNIGPT